MAFDIVIGADAQPATFSIVIGTTPSSVIPGAGPAGVTTFAIDVDARATVTYEWQTDLLKAVDGSEQRAALLARPRQRYEMRALLTDAEHRQILARLAVSGASGALFNLRLPYEELSVTSCSGTTVTVETLSLCDWADPGQRVTVVHPVTGVAIDAVVQSAAGADILLDVDVSSVAIAGARIMPIVGVYLDPSQALDRYRVKLGTWDIRARADRFRFGFTGNVGAGAAVTTFDGLPVWDVGVVNRGGTRAESVATGVEIVDLGAKIATIGNFTHPDWVRGVLIESSEPETWQWFKAFIHTVRGRCKAFLLPTGRPDLVPVSLVANELIISGADYVADWYSSLAHRRVWVTYANGASAAFGVASAEVVTGTTQRLNLSAAPASLPVSVEFLETVRLDQDAISVAWDGGTFSSEFAVRTLQQ